MKKIFKTLLTILVSAAILFSGVVGISADLGSQEILPRLNITVQNRSNFTISDTNKANVIVSYVANSTVFQKANVTVKLEKRFLLLFWTTVDIGYSNNEWKASSTNPNGVLSNTFTVNGKGVYRAHITLEIIGNNGQTDVIEETLEFEYK